MECRYHADTALTADILVLAYRQLFSAADTDTADTEKCADNYADISDASIGPISSNQAHPVIAIFLHRLSGRLVMQFHNLLKERLAGMSKRAGGGGNATVTRGLCVGYWYKLIINGMMYFGTC